MRLIDRAIDMPRLVILGAVLICAAGAAALLTLPKERQPRVKLPVITVAVPHPGASPTDNESQVLRRIEDESATLTGLRERNYVNSQAVQGATVVQFVFDHSRSVDEARRDVESMINRIKSQFPDAAQRDPGPIVRDIGYDDWPVIQVFIAGGNDGTHRRRVAERLQTELEAVAGVTSVDIFGGHEKEIQIEVNPHLMVLYGFNYQQVEGAIRKANMQMPSGSIESGPTDQRVKTASRIEKFEDIAAIPVGVSDNKPVFLADIATVTMGSKPRQNIARYGGQDAVVLLVRPKTDIDMLAASDACQHVVDQFIAKGGADGTQIGTARSQARDIRYMLGQLGSNAMQGTVLVILMLWLSFGWRNASLIAISFPFCVLGTAAFMWVAKLTINPDLAINNMVLFAIIVVVGEVADGAIIVGENIYRNRELGMTGLEAARHGVREVAGSLLAAYLTTVAGFMPLLIVRGVMGDFLGVLPIVTLFSLIAAVIAAYIVIPTLSVYLMKRPRKVIAPPRNEDGSMMTEDEVTIANAQALVALSPLKQWYGRLLRYMLHHRIMVLSFITLLTLVPVVGYYTGAVGFEFMPDGNRPTIEVYFEVPLGSSMENKTTEVADRIEKAVLEAVKPEEWFKPSETAERLKPVTTIGNPAELNIRLDADRGSGPEFGMVYVELESPGERERTTTDICRAIEKALPRLPGVITHVFAPTDGPPAGAPVLVRILGHKETPLDRLAERAAEVEAVLRTIPGVYDISSDHRMRTDLVVNPNRATASLFDVDAGQITSSVSYALEGVKVGEVDFGGDEQIDLRLRNLAEHRATPADLANLPIHSATGKIVTLAEVADIDRSPSANTIRHYDRKRAISIRAELTAGVLPDQVKAQLVRALRTDLSASQQRHLVNGQAMIAADEDVTVEFGGENEVRDDAAYDMQVAMAIAFALMLLIFVVQFNSFVVPIVVLFSVPVCLIGVAVGLMIFDMNFSIMAMIGIVALSGVVVDNAAVMIEFIFKMREKGVPHEQAIVFAGQFRVRPLILTTLTNVVGMLPVALNIGGGAQLWQPLAVTIIFGLGFATMMQLVLVPMMCYTFGVGKKLPAKASSGEDSLPVFTAQPAA